MAPSNNTQLSSDLLADFRQEAAEQFQRSEQLLIELEQTPDDSERLHDLFRQIHTLKGNLGYIGLSTLMPLPQALEDVLDQLRKGRLCFDSLLGDILLLSLDHLKEQIEQSLQGSVNDLARNQLAALSAGLRALTCAKGAQQADIRDALLRQLDPKTRVSAPSPASFSRFADLCERYAIIPGADLFFFAELMQASERRSHYWQGRGMRQLELALAINQAGGSPAQPAQLAAAVCLHDLGMAFLPLDLLHKRSEYDRQERQQMQDHPCMAHALLQRMPTWAEAAQIILQHQEHVDGSGYPNRLREQQICPGALILHIVDAFDARTHERAHQTLSKRPLLRAILEINGLAGSQFSDHWVGVFNHTLHQHPDLAHL